MSTFAFIGIGANIDYPLAHVIMALGELNNSSSVKLVKTSSIYESIPVGPQDQPNFINAVLKLETTLSPIELLDFLQAIENRHNRKREKHWGPRTLDLDILYYGDEIINNDRLIVPHIEIQNRAFVVIPLLDIDNDFICPKTKVQLKESVKALPQNDITGLKEIIPSYVFNNMLNTRD